MTTFKANEDDTDCFTTADIKTSLESSPTRAMLVAKAESSLSDVSISSLFLVSVIYFKALCVTFSYVWQPASVTCATCRYLQHLILQVRNICCISQNKGSECYNCNYIMFGQYKSSGYLLFFFFIWLELVYSWLNGFSFAQSASY